MSDIVTTVAPQAPEQIELNELPTEPGKLRRWLLEIASKQEIYQKGRMRSLNAATTVAVLKAGLLALERAEEARKKEQQTYLVARWGAVMVGLDAAQPAEGDVIIAERKDGQREQGVVYQGNVYLWRNGVRGIKFCSVSTLAKWRLCEMPEMPAETGTVKDEVIAALERGRAQAGNGAGLTIKPGAGVPRSFTKEIPKPKQ